MSASPDPGALLLRVSAQGGPPTVVSVAAGAGADAGTVAAALGRHLGWPAGRAVTITDAAGGPVPAGASLNGLGLRSGHEIRLVERHPVERGRPPASLSPAPEVPGDEPAGDWGRVVVVGGPGAAELAAPVGLVPVTLGRDRGCGLALPDPRLGRVVATIAQDPDRPEVAVVVAEAGSDLAVDDEPVDGARELLPGAVLTVGETSLRYEPPGAAPPLSPVSAGGAVTVSPGPRYIPPPAPVVIDPVGVLPEPSAPPRLRLAAATAPLLMGLVMAVTVSPRFLFLVLVSPLVLVLGHVEGRWQARRRYRADHARAEEALAAQRERVAQARAEERAQRHLLTPDLARVAQWAVAQSPELWSRTRTDPSFGLVRLGLGEVPSAVTVRPETRGDPALRATVNAELRLHRRLPAAPVTVDLAGGGVVALVGRHPDTDAVVAGLLLQLAVLHRPADLALAAAPEPGSDLARWVGWLPHLRSPNHPLGYRGLAPDPGSATALLRPVAAAAAVVAANPGPARPAPRAEPHMVLVVDAGAGVEPGVAARAIEAVPAGVTILWRATEERDVPRSARAVIRCRPPTPGSVSTLTELRPNAGAGGPAPIVEPVPVRLDRPSTDTADRIARCLAHLHDPAATGPAGRPPDAVTLVEALTPAGPAPTPAVPGPGSVAEVTTGEGVLARWAATPPVAVPVPLGVDADGPVTVDLVADGPHLLIGGTTGAGKSELLASMVAGLVSTAHPRQVNVLFVDFKGGALADQFTGVPHVVGSVSNLDPLEASRALRALRAELERRMTVLQGRARDRAELLARHPDVAFPALVIVIDEFATIARQLPDFMAGMIDLAQRGRSLGIHLVLATQRPSVAVDENVLANTSIRVALRTLDEAESRRLVGVGDAAAIDVGQRGRALVRLGPRRLHLIQAPFASAPAAGDPGSVAVPVAVTSLTASDGTGCPGSTAGPGPLAPVTQLHQVRGAVIAAAAVAGCRPAARPWLAPLPATIPIDEVLAGDGPSGTSLGPLPVGLADLPDEQTQRPATIDLGGRGGLVVLGTSGSGRSTALGAVAGGLLRSRPDVILIGFDGGAGPLARLGPAERCAGVAPIDDLEATTRQIAALERELRHRRAEPEGDHPPVVVLVDDLDGVAGGLTGSGAPPSLHRWYEALIRVMVEGHGVGIAAVVSARRRASVPTALLAAAGHRLALRQAEAAGWAELGLPGSALAGVDLPPGRGFLDGVLIQVARADTGPPVAEPPPARAARPTSGGGPSGGPASPTVRLATAPLPRLVRAEPSTVRGRVVIGVADITGDPAAVAIDTDPVWVVGDHRSGRSTVLATVADALAATHRPCWLVVPPRSPLAGSGRPGVVIADRPDTLAVAIDRLLASVGPPPGPDAVSMGGPVLIVDDLDRLDGPALDARAAALIAAGIPLVAATTAGRVGLGGLLTRHLRQAPTVIHLRPRSSRHVQETTGMGVVLRPVGERPPGRAVLVAPSGGITEVQVVVTSGAPVAGGRGRPPGPA
ncbi:MAG: FtsK/SpoIIIE domain-containing protein [Acidimicrobiales bacterium]